MKYEKFVVEFYMQIRPFRFDGTSWVMSLLFTVITGGYFEVLLILNKDLPGLMEYLTVKFR